MPTGEQRADSAIRYVHEYCLRALGWWICACVATTELSWARYPRTKGRSVCGLTFHDHRTDSQVTICASIDFSNVLRMAPLAWVLHVDDRHMHLQLCGILPSAWCWYSTSSDGRVGTPHKPLAAFPQASVFELLEDVSADNVMVLHRTRSPLLENVVTNIYLSCFPHHRREERFCGEWARGWILCCPPYLKSPTGA